MTEISELLAAHIHAAADQPWAWGRADCTMWVADWCFLRWGVDPAGDYRGTYDTQAGADALVAGGLIDRVSPHLTWAVKALPDPGDIGVIEVCGRQIAAIWTGKHWAFRTPAGVGFTPRAAICAWGG